MINDFLKKIAEEIKTKERKFTQEDFYFILKYMGVTKDSTLKDDILKFYNDFLTNLNDSLVKYDCKKTKNDLNTTNYIAFYVDKKANYKDAIKVYFPVKYEYLISSLKTVFLYLIRNSIKSQVKFYVKSTNENIVIRFYNPEDVIPFIHYCDNNFILKDLLVTGNPFIVKYKGIGLVKDDNTINTYNGTLALMLEEYFNLLCEEESLNNACDIDFLDYLIKRGNLEENPEMKFNINSIEKSIRIILNKGELDEKDLI